MKNREYPCKRGEMRWNKVDEQIIVYTRNFWYLNSWTQYFTEPTLVARERLITTQFISSKGEYGIWGGCMLAMLDANGLYCARRIVGLDVPEQKKGNQKFLLKFLLRKLNSEEVETNEDGGASWFQKLHDHLSKYFQPGGQTKFWPETELSNKGLFAPTYNNNVNTNVSPDSEQQNQSSHPPIRSFYNLQWLKDFKINGSIGGPGERDKLSYTSLAYQMTKVLGFQKLKFVPGL